MMRYLLLLGIGMGLAACAGGGARAPGDYRMVYSPHGVPLNGGVLGPVACRVALGRWFDAQDAQGRGFIDQGPYMAQAASAFVQMDLDRDGYLTAAELEQYRKPYRQEAPDQRPKSALRGDKAHRRGPARDGDAPETVAPLADASDPVMAADVNLDFKVTRAEYNAYAQKNYAFFDRQSGQRGLARADVLRPCDDPGPDADRD